LAQAILAQATLWLKLLEIALQSTFCCTPLRFRKGCFFFPFLRQS